MGGYEMIILLAFLVDGVFGADPFEVSVIEGESVTLNCAKKEEDIMKWYFNDILIAHINGHPNTSCLYDGEGGIFRDRLEVGHKSGSLIITNITTEHAGRYEAELIRSEGSGKEERLSRNQKCDSTKIFKKNSWVEIKKTLIVNVTVSVIEGESVTLNCAKKEEDIMEWYFNDILIAHINGHPNTSCLYDGEGGIFRDRLEVGHKSGSLIITDITTEHAGRYEAELIRSEGSGKEERLNRNQMFDSTKIFKKNSWVEIKKTLIVNVTAGKAEPRMDIKEKETDKTVPGSGLSSGAVAGIVVVAVLIAAAAVGVIYSFHQRLRKRDEEIRKPELLSKILV